VLTAIGVPNDICAGSITFSMSKYTTEEEIDKVIEVTPEIVQRLCENVTLLQKNNVGGKYGKRTIQ